MPKIHKIKKDKINSNTSKPQKTSKFLTINRPTTKFIDPDPKNLYIVFNEDDFECIVCREEYDLDQPHPIHNTYFENIVFKLSNDITVKNIKAKQKLDFSKQNLFQDFNNKELLLTSKEVLENIFDNIFNSNAVECKDLLLCLAVENNNQTVCKIMLDNGANPNYYDHKLGQQNYLIDECEEEHTQDICENGSPLLNRIVSTGNTKLLELFITYHICFHELEQNQACNAGHCAIDLKNIEMLKMLLNNKMYVDCSDHEGKTLLYYCVETYNEDEAEIYNQMIEILLDHKADTNVVDIYNYSLIHIVVANLPLEIASKFIVKGADINATVHYMDENERDTLDLPPVCSNSVPTERNGNNLLHQAVIDDDLGKVEWLLNYNINVNHQNDLQKTPLHLSVIHNNVKIFQKLLHAGASITIKDDEDKICIDYCTEDNREEFLDVIRSNDIVTLYDFNCTSENDSVSIHQGNIDDEDHESDVNGKDVNDGNNF